MAISDLESNERINREYRLPDDRNSDKPSAEFNKGRQPRMAYFEGIRRIAESANTVDIIEVGDAISLVPKTTGFPITVAEINIGQYSVSLGGFYEDEYDAATISDLIKSSLKGDIKIVATTLNGDPWKYLMMARNQVGVWNEVSQTRYVRFTMFRRIEQTYTHQFMISN